MVVGDLGAEPVAPRVGDPVPVTGRADRRHVHQRLAQPHAGKGVGQLRRRCVGQGRADLEPSVSLWHLELPPGVVVAVAPPQQHAVRLQVTVGGVVVGTAERDGAAFHVGSGDDVVESGDREMLVHVPLQFAF